MTPSELSSAADLPLIEQVRRLSNQLAEADAVIAYSVFDDGRATKDKLRWADEALARHRARQQENDGAAT